jgi:hypothetical protein
MAQQNQLAKPVLPELSSQHQQFLSQMVDTINSLQGYNGPTKLNNHLDLNGYQVKNVGAPTSSTDAITHGVAEASYSADALAPKLESTGKNSLKTMRQLNSPVQREQTSSFLNDLMSSVPNANAIVPLLTNIGSPATGVRCVIPAGPFTFVDGSTVMLQGRTDLFSLPTSYAISSISCVGNVVTVASTAPVTEGQAITIAGVSPSSFNGSVTVSSAGSGSFTYQADLGTVSGSGGRVEENGVHYYAVRKRSGSVILLPQQSGDTMANRLHANLDGSQIVAVVVVNASGFQVSQSGGGGSAIVGSPTAGSFF